MMWHNTLTPDTTNPTMQRPLFFLRTKLLAPRTAAQLLERPRLIHRLESNLNAPVTLVAADAGCGKTTLIGDFVSRQTRPCVWYQLDHTDADPAVFLTYLTHGIRNISPGFGDAVFAYLTEAGEELVRCPERAVDALINEVLQSIEQPFILVLDDYHHIGTETIVHTMVDRLLQYSTDLIHLMITTRDLPPLAIMRRRARGAALVITRDDLLFTDDEVRQLFRETLGVDLADDEIAEYHDRTHGWATALQLVRQAAEQKMHSGEGGTRLDIRDVLKRSERDIFDYFAEEVFSRETPETQNLLLHLSLLESLPLDLCSALFPEYRCAASLPALAQKNMFLSVAGTRDEAEEYRFHPLFREFLRRRLRSEIGREGVAKERIRIAEYFLDRRLWEAALSYLLDAEAFDEAARVIASTGGDWIAAGSFISLGTFADRVPEDALGKFPRSLLYKAEVARLRGEIDGSTRTLEKARSLLHGSGDGQGEAEALHSLASIARRRAKFDEAPALLEQAEQLAEPGSETMLKCANTRGLCLIVAGDLNAAERQFRVALEIAEKIGSEHYVRLVAHNLALAPGLRGDFGEALRWLNRIFREDKPERRLPQEAIGHLNAARLHTFRGELDSAERHLERSLELCQLFNMQFLRGEIFEALGNLYRERRDAAHAEEFYSRARSAYEEAGIDPTTKELFEEWAVFYLNSGDPARARARLSKLIAGREMNSAGGASNTARLRMLQTDLAEKRTVGLPEKIEAVVAEFRAQNQYYYDAVGSMLLAEAYAAAGDDARMVEPIQRALDLSARFDYDYWLRSEIRRLPHVFSHEDIADRLPPDLRKETRAAPETRPELSAERAVISDLTVNVLGHVEIFRDSTRPFAADAWTTRRARDIFCYIATSKQRRVAKDVLIDAFWPDEDPAAIEKNFHPTISHIRKALNSRQTLKQNFILFRDGAYQLNPELTYAIDTEQFEMRVAEAETAKRGKNAEALRCALESAYALYRGEFMPGIYDPWVDDRRGFYAEQFSRVISALAKQCFGEKKWSKALKYAGETLVIDPFREDMHRLAMKVFAAQSKPASVKKQFEDLQALLKKELGIDPAPETRRVYRELIR
jgi:LuxR family transcriptional regulator, maltose regulon positive regulatory protein